MSVAPVAGFQTLLLAVFALDTEEQRQVLDPREMRGQDEGILRVVGNLGKV